MLYHLTSVYPCMFSCHHLVQTTICYKWNHTLAYFSCHILLHFLRTMHNLKYNIRNEDQVSNTIAFVYSELFCWFYTISKRRTPSSYYCIFKQWKSKCIAWNFILEESKQALMCNDTILTRIPQPISYLDWENFEMVSFLV